MARQGAPGGRWTTRASRPCSRAPFGPPMKRP